MTGCDWIVCERTGRWAAALRLALEQDFPADRRPARVYEVRNQRDLAAWLNGRRDCLVAMEVDRANFAQVLPWLAAAPRQFPRARFVALLDRSLRENRETGEGHDEARDAQHALGEAGAAEIVCSPLRLQTLLAFAGRHASACAADRVAARDDLSRIDEVWDSLPWQGQSGRVG